MIRGHAVSERDGNARIWTLTVNTMPTPGALIEWDEPECGSIPAQTGVRGWLSSEESNRPGTQLLIVAGHGSRWVKIVVKPRMIDAITGDDLLTALAEITPDNRYRALEGMGVRILREAADLCGIDSEGMGKRAAIMAIVTNF